MANKAIREVAMLNPRQLAEKIDAVIARSRSRARTLDIGRATSDVLSSLPLDDRRGIDPEMLELIVAARGMSHRDLHLERRPS